VLYETPGKKENFFYMCNHCGQRENSEMRCAKCNSWKLITLGIGADLIEKEVSKAFPDIKIWRIDSDNTPKEKEVKKVIHNFLKSPGSVLIATEMILRYLKDRVENTVVVSLDSVIALPEFRSAERLFYILSTIRTRTTREMLVQTRNPDFDAFKHFPMGNILEFSREELSIRQSTEYPPYSTIIKLTIKGTRDNVIEEMGKVRELIHEIEFDVFPSFTYSPKGEYILHAIARVPKKDWPNSHPMNIVLAKLKSLPPWIEARIDPDSLL
jgi:primosomal protein N' (replication factor Y)